MKKIFAQIVYGLNILVLVVSIGLFFLASYSLLIGGSIVTQQGIAVWNTRIIVATITKHSGVYGAAAVNYQLNRKIRERAGNKALFCAICELPPPLPSLLSLQPAWYPISYAFL